MKIKKIIITIITILLAMGFDSVCKAYTISIDDVTAKKGEEFKVTLKGDEYIGIATGSIKFDNSKLEFVKAETNSLDTNIDENGNLLWIYMNEKFMQNQFGENDNPEDFGTKELSFTFKIKKNGKSDLEFEDLALVGLNGGEYSDNETNNNIQGNKKITVKSKGNNFIIIIGIVAAVFILLLVGKTIKKSNKK